MDFKDQIKQLGDRILKLKDQIATEEATKNAFIMPMLQVLGYDVFNPLEIVPEFTCDIGTKKGEKIDYAIVRDGVPLILIECKHWKQNLNVHEGQLIRYFQAANSRFGVLTNGIKYRFYHDIDKPNIMDDKPFFEFDVTDMKENEVEELKKFHKSYFDLESIATTAIDLKYTAEIKNLILKEISEPSEWFVRDVIKIVYDGRATDKVVEQFTALTKKSFAQVISDMITDRLRHALREEQALQPAAPSSEETVVVKVGDRVRVGEKEVVVDRVCKSQFADTEGKWHWLRSVGLSEEDAIPEPTQEEMECFYTIRTVLREHCEPQKISYNQTQTYFAVLLDGSARKPLARLHFRRGAKKYIEVFDDFKNAERYEYTGINDVYAHVQEMVESIEIYDGKRQPDPNNSRKKKNVPPAEDTPNPA